MRDFVQRTRFTVLMGFCILSLPLPGQQQRLESPHSAAAEVRRMSALVPIATFHVGGDPDWMAVADGAIWVTSSTLNRVTQLKGDDNRVGLRIPVAQPCSGMVVGFGSLWIPSCGNHSLVRADLKTAHILAAIPISPANSEGCIAAGAGSIWLATSPTGVLSRIDPTTNTVAASIHLPSGSYRPVFADGFVWVTSTEHSLLSKVDPSTNRVLAEIPVGKNPRFAVAGADSLWTLNQGDGTVSRVDIKTGKLVANIPAGLSGHGGEITFGFGSVWATLDRTPITRIDAKTNSVVRRWTGDGGDSIRAGLGSIWLTNLKAGIVLRISPDRL
jgi:YVTN family beta-propeller protein